MALVDRCSNFFQVNSASGSTQPSIPLG